MALVPEGRAESTSHDTANFRIAPLEAKRLPPASELPVAGLPRHEGEIHIVQRAKRRPALVISAGGVEVPKELRVGGALDKLPIGGPAESILRLDHLQPLGKHGANYQLTEWSLVDDALVVLGEWLFWLMEERLPEASVLLELRSGLAQGANDT